MVEFMNLRQGAMIVQEYSFKFTLLSKYAQSMVDNPRDRMNKFLMGDSSLVEKSVVWQCLLMTWISLGSWSVHNKMRSPKLRR